MTATARLVSINTQCYRSRWSRLRRWVYWVVSISQSLLAKVQVLGLCASSTHYPKTSQTLSISICCSLFQTNSIRCYSSLVISLGFAIRSWTLNTNRQPSISTAVQPTSRNSSSTSKMQICRFRSWFSWMSSRLNWANLMSSGDPRG